jgi:hypothetical protein
MAGYWIPSQLRVLDEMPRFVAKIIYDQFSSSIFHENANLFGITVFLESRNLTKTHKSLKRRFNGGNFYS